MSNTTDSSLPTRPVGKRPVRELLELANVDVSDWAFTKDGDEIDNPNDNIGRNTRWAFSGEADEPVVLCIWFDNIDWDAQPPIFHGNEYLYQQKLIQLAGIKKTKDGIGRLNSKISRSRELHAAVFEAHKHRRPVNLILVDGEQVALEDSADKASIVSARSIDSESWYVHQFDGTSGDFTLVRSVKPTIDAVDILQAVVDTAGDPIFRAFVETLNETERDALIKVRVGQGPFRDSLIARWGGCSVTACKNPEVLVASHIKPWSSCTTASERLDAANGLLLTPNLDKLFDRGLVSFDDDFRIMLSSELKAGMARALNVDKHMRLASHEFNDIRPFLSWHRENVFRE